MNKKAFYIFFLLVILFVFSACEAGNRILDIELAKAPDKLEYIANHDDRISFTGGKIRLITGYKTIFGISETNSGFSEPLDEYIKDNNMEIMYIPSFDNISKEEKRILVVV